MLKDELYIAAEVIAVITFLAGMVVYILELAKFVNWFVW